MATLQYRSETSALLNESAGRPLASVPDREIRAAQLGQWSVACWHQVAEAGFPLAFVREEAGGFGVEAIDLVRIAGYHAAPVPLAETMLANRLLTEAGFEAAQGPATIAPVSGTAAFALERGGSGWRIRGRAAGVPWARHVDQIVAMVEHDGKPWVIRLDRKRVDVAQDVSLAGLPRDVVTLDIELSGDDVRPPPSRWTCATLKAAGAALRVAEMAGALERVLEMTVTYANERVQFGKPIGKQPLQELAPFWPMKIAR